VVLLYVLMKGNIYYAVFLAMVLLVFLLATGPAATFATTTATTEPTQLQGTMNQTQTTQEESVRVAVAEGSNDTVQYYTFTP
jgi:galactitol-specific phosphotransferase system IIC component